MAVVEADLGLLAEPFLKKAQRLEALIESEGLPFRIFETRRSFTRSQTLYNQGRTFDSSGLTISVDKTKIVSNARAGESPHNWGLALDAILITDKTHAWWMGHQRELPLNPWDLGDAQRPIIKLAWERYGRCVRTCELSWGGDWTGFKDWPHAELRAWTSFRPQDWKAVVLRELALGR